MDLKQYFRRIREIEATIAEPYVLISSLETPDGGKAGVMTEQPRALAAKTIAEGRGLLASKAEAKEYYAQQEAMRAAAQKAEIARRLQVTVITDTDGPAGTPGLLPSANLKK